MGGRPHEDCGAPARRATVSLCLIAACSARIAEDGSESHLHKNLRKTSNELIPFGVVAWRQSAYTKCDLSHCRVETFFNLRR